MSNNVNDGLSASIADIGEIHTGNKEVYIDARYVRFHRVYHLSDFCAFRKQLVNVVTSLHRGILRVRFTCHYM